MSRSAKGILILIVASTVSLTSMVHAEGEPELISQEEFLELLVKNHPVFEKERLSAEIQRQERESYAGAKDWYLFSTVAYAHLEPAIAFASPETTDSINASAGVERLFWKTGGRFSASYETGYVNVEIDPVYGIPDSYYENQFSLTYTHPILKNKNGFLDRLQYELQQFDIDFSEIEAEENLENFLAAAAERFLDWVFLSEEKKNVQQRLKLSEEELERTKRKRKSFLVDQADVIRNEEAVQLWKQNLVSVEAQWLALQAELAVLSQSEKMYSCQPDFDLYRLGETDPLEKLNRDLDQNSRLLKLLKTRKEQLHYSRTGFEETLKPDLALTTEVNIKAADEEVGAALGMDKPDAYLGLKWSIPWKNTTVRAQLSKTDLVLKQLDREIEKVHLELTAALTNLYIQSTKLEQVLALNREHILAAEQRTEEEIKLYNQGRGDMTFIIQSRDNVKNAQLTYARNALFYQKLKLQLKAILDELFPTVNHNTGEKE